MSGGRLTLADKDLLARLPAGTWVEVDDGLTEILHYADRATKPPSLGWWFRREDLIDQLGFHSRMVTR
jgi:hypothetical protein